MSVLSFDIGIKNLSYCIVCKDTKKIQDWGIINISCNKECEHINTKNNKCDKKATFINDNILLCSQHSKNKKYTNVKKYKNNQNTIFNIGILLLKEIKKKEFNKFNIEDVLLENQPCLKNPTMKSIQMIIYTYFIELLYHFKYSRYFGFRYILILDIVKRYLLFKNIVSLNTNY